MALSTELQSLKVLVKQLEVLANTQPGDPVSSRNWNDIVKAIIKVANTLQVCIQVDSVPLHEHPDQVTLGWLHPKLRQVIEQGPLSDPAYRARLLDIEKQLRILNERFEAFETSLKDVRQRVDDTVTRDLSRESDIIDVRRKFDVLAGAGDEVLNLRQTLQGIEQQIDVALKLNDLFDVNGQPPDFTSLTQRLNSAEGDLNRFRVNDRFMDGEAILAELEALRNEIDERIGSGEGISPEQVQALQSNLGISIDKAVSGLESRTNERFDKDRSEADATISALGKALESLRATTLASFEEAAAERKRLEKLILERSGGVNEQQLFEMIDKRLIEFQPTLEKSIIERLQREGFISNPNERPGTGPTVSGGSADTTTRTTQSDDFTKITGIGESFAKILNDNGIRTYRQLAAMNPEKLAGLLGRSLSVAEQIIKEAGVLARRA